MPIEEVPVIKKVDNEFFRRLDAYALRLQKNPDDEEAFENIHMALHKFIIRGQEGKDLYQESLIVLWQKAIPSFNPARGMSFWGFAKMCINRHLITILNSAINRKKDIPMNQSVSIDELFGDEDDENNCCLQNILKDNSDFFLDLCFNEDKEKTINELKETLSPFECVVLMYYLEGLSYREIALRITEEFGKKCKDKSVDNALLRIRRKAEEISSYKKLPFFDEEWQNKKEEDLL